MSPTDLPQCHQHPGKLEKLVDHQESTQGLACPRLAQGLKLQHIKTRTLLAEVVHLHLGDEEPFRERFVYEQQEASSAARQQKQQRLELEKIAGSLRNELIMQAEQHLNHYVQQEQAYFTAHLRNVESHLQAKVANTKFHLQKET